MSHSTYRHSVAYELLLCLYICVILCLRRLCAAENIMFSLCPVVCPDVQCQVANMYLSTGRRVHYTHAAAEASYDRARS